MRRLCLEVLVAALVAAIACHDSSGPRPPVPGSQLHFLVQAPTAPPLAALRDSFWAKVGQDRDVRLLYQTGQEFLRFEVPSNGLFLKPDGSSFQPGDSILITVTVPDPARFVFDFEPTGLQFNPSDPARLKILYYDANHDFNGDGRIDSTDARIETQLDIWRREPPDTVWTRLGAVNFESLNELDVEVLHFTDHAIAW
jgi:hypothetical protein